MIVCSDNEELHKETKLFVKYTISIYLTTICPDVKWWDAGCNSKPRSIGEYKPIRGELIVWKISTYCIYFSKCQLEAFLSHASILKMSNFYSSTHTERPWCR